MLRTFFSFSGRIGRKTFWLSLLALVVIMTVIMVAGVSVLGMPAMAPGQPPDLSHPIFAFYGVMSLLSLWPSLAIYVKRLHDRNMSGWWLLLPYVLMFVPVGVMFAMMGPDAMVQMQAGQMPAGSGIMMAVMAGAYIIALLLFLWLFIVTGFLRGTNGPNRFGPDPLGGTGSDVPPPGHDWAN